MPRGTSTGRVVGDLALETLKPAFRRASHPGAEAHGGVSASVGRSRTDRREARRDHRHRPSHQRPARRPKRQPPRSPAWRPERLRVRACLRRGAMRARAERSTASLRGEPGICAGTKSSSTIRKVFRAHLVPMALSRGRLRAPPSQFHLRAIPVPQRLMRRLRQHRANASR